MRFKYSADLRRSGLVNRNMKLLVNFAAWVLFEFFNINLFHKKVIVSVFDVVSYFKNFSNQGDFTFGLYNSKSRKPLVVKQAVTGASGRHIQGSKIAKGLPSVNLQYSKIEKA